MACTDTLSGKLVDLKCADVEDAQFSLDIRNDPSLTEFIPKVQGSYEGQVQWIAKERENENSYFFIVLNKKGESIGTVSLYKLDKANSICEFGRYISYGNAMENVEIALLILNFAYLELDMENIIFNNDERNLKIISFWKRFGATLNKIEEMDGWVAAQYLLSKEDYMVKRERIIPLLDGRK